MFRISKTTILLLLALLVGGGGVLSPFRSLRGETLFSFLLEEKVDFDDSEESSESKLAAISSLGVNINNRVAFYAVSDEANHQMDWLYVYGHAARAPPRS